MREIARPVARALNLACLAVAMAGLTLAMAALSSGDALAQAKQAPPKQAAPPAQAAPPPQQEAPLKQVALTEAHVAGVLSAAKEIDPVTEKLPDDGKAPDPKLIAQLDGIAKKNGFASFDDYNTVVDNITLVLSGFDAATKKYVGPEAVIKSQIAAVQADKKIPPKDKKEALADLNAALKSPQPVIENKGNIDLVTKHYDKLAETLSEE